MPSKITKLRPRRLNDDQLDFHYTRFFGWVNPRPHGDFEVAFFEIIFILRELTSLGSHRTWPSGQVNLRSAFELQHTSLSSCSSSQPLNTHCNKGLVSSHTGWEARINTAKPNYFWLVWSSMVPPSICTGRLYNDSHCTNSSRLVNVWPAMSPNICAGRPS